MRVQAIIQSPAKTVPSAKLVGILVWGPRGADRGLGGRVHPQVPWPSCFCSRFLVRS